MDLNVDHSGEILHKIHSNETLTLAVFAGVMTLSYMWFIKRILVGKSDIRTWMKNRK